MTITMTPQTEISLITEVSPIQVHNLTEQEAIKLLAEKLFLEGETIGLSNPPDANGEITDYKDCRRSELIEQPDVCKAYERITVSPLSKKDGITVFRHVLVQLNQATQAASLLKSGINVSAIIQEQESIWAWIVVNSTSLKEYEEAIAALNTLLAGYHVQTCTSNNSSVLPRNGNRLLYLNPLAITHSPAATKKAQQAIKAEAKAEQIEAKQAINLTKLLNLHGGKPTIQLAGEDRLLSDFANELADHVKEHLYLRNGEVVVLEGTELKPIKANSLRTWVENYVVCYRQVGAGRKLYQIGITMGNDAATGVLCAPQFLSKLRRIQQVNDCRLPVMRDDGTIELLPTGYDARAQVLTLEAVKYDTEMSTADAKSIIDDLLSEFIFADASRSKSVVIAGMTGLYGKHLLPPLSLRPCFIMTANAEGAGKGLITSIMIAPALGSRPVGRKAETDDEVAKVLVTSIKESRPLLLLDNVRGYLASPSLEAFLTAPKYEDRRLGSNEFISGENVTQVIITGNGLTVSPDIRRRSLFVELKLEVERAEDRTIKRPLEAATLLAMRPKLLAALWAFVKDWNVQSRPAPSKVNAQLLSWSNIIAGIVENAGYGCALETANVAIAADQDGKDMRILVVAMVARDEWTFKEVVELARKSEVFSNVLGDAVELDRKARRIFSDILKKYNGRLVLNWRFTIEGDGHSRRYSVEDLVVPIPAVEVSKSDGKETGLHDRMIQHDVSANQSLATPLLFQLKHHADHVIMQIHRSFQTSNHTLGATFIQNQVVVENTSVVEPTPPQSFDDQYSYKQLREEVAKYI